MGFVADSIQRFLKERVRFGIPKVSLRLVLTAPFVVQIISIVGLVGYLSYQSGQQAVENLANQLLRQTSERVSDRLNSYLELPQKIVETNHLAANQGTLDLNNSEQLRERFWQQMQLNPLLPMIGFFGEDGKGVNYFRITSKEFQLLAEKASGQSIPIGTVLINPIIPNQRDYFTIDAQGKPLKLIFQFKDDFRNVKWYQKAKMDGKQAWTTVILARVAPILQTLAVDPLLDNTGKFKGFFVASYFLSEISLFLNQIRLSPKGQVFILEDQGDLVATSIASEASAKSFSLGKFSRLNAKDSQYLLTREVTKQLIEQFGSLDFKESKQLSLNVAGQRQFVQISPYQDKYGLDWQIVTVVPESDFTAQIQDNVRQTILWCGLALIVTIITAILLANWITRPIIRLSKISDRMAKGEWQDSSDSDHPDQEESAIAEIQTLLTSFNLMSKQLRQSLDQTSAALQEKAYWFNTLVEAIPDPIFLKDGEGKWLIANPQALQLFEMEGIDYFGKTDLELAEINSFYHDVLLYCADTDRAAWEQNITRNEEQITQTDGSQYIFDVVRVPLYTENGDRKGLVVIGRDISALKYAESILRPYERVVSATPDCIALIDLNYNYLLINQSYMDWHCKSYEEIIGHSVSDLLGAENFETIAKPRFDLCFKGEAQHFEGWIDKPEAGLLYIDATYSPYLDENGTITGIVINVRNISDRQQAILDLERKTEELDSFFSVSQDMFAIANAEGYFLRLNSQWEKTLSRQVQLNIR